LIDWLFIQFFNTIQLMQIVEIKANLFILILLLLLLCCVSVSLKWFGFDVQWGFVMKWKKERDKMIIIIEHCIIDDDWLIDWKKLTKITIIFFFLT